VSTFKYQLYDMITGANEGDFPYRYIGRALHRLQWLNLVAGENRYSLKPVRMRE
jgi:hypothetical protein